jgi:hypothetical protein
LQVNVHALATHSVVPFATSGHALLQAPQWFSLVVASTHSAPQRRGAFGGQPVVHANVVPMGAHAGAVGGQTALHAPQLVGFERSTSHPFAGFLSQSAKPGSQAAIAHADAWHADDA